MTVKKMQFQWNLPVKVDPEEPEITVTFDFSKGNGKAERFPGDPRCSPAEVEDICYTNPATGLIERPEEGGELWHELEQACWGYAEEQEPVQ